MDVLFVNKTILNEKNVSKLVKILQGLYTNKQQRYTFILSLFSLLVFIASIFYGKHFMLVISSLIIAIITTIIFFKWNVISEKLLYQIYKGRIIEYYFYPDKLKIKYLNDKKILKYQDIDNLIFIEPDSVLIIDKEGTNHIIIESKDYIKLREVLENCL